MDFDLDYRFTLNCEIDKESYRPCDSIRTQLLQLVACKNQLPLPVYLDRQKDLLEKYSINIDDPKGINTYINSAIHIFKNESSRNYSAKNWKSSLKKRIDDGLTIGDLLPMNNNLHFKNLQQLSAKFREHQNNRTICINTENNHQSSLPAYLNNFQPIVDPDKNLLKNKPCKYKLELLFEISLMFFFLNFIYQKYHQILRIHQQDHRDYLRKKVICATNLYFMVLRNHHLKVLKLMN